MGNSGAALRAILKAKPRSLHARELSEKNRRRLEKEFAKEVLETLQDESVTVWSSRLVPRTSNGPMHLDVLDPDCKANFK